MFLRDESFQTTLVKKACFIKQPYLRTMPYIKCRRIAQFFYIISKFVGLMDLYLLIFIVHVACGDLMCSSDILVSLKYYYSLFFIF